MDQPLELLQSLARNGDRKSLTEYLQFCSESKLFCLSGDKINSTISLINSLLSSRENHIDGLSILNVFIEQCPKDVLGTNVLPWVQQTIKSLVNPHDNSINPISWKVLGRLIQVSTEYPETRKYFAQNIIPKVLDHFVREAEKCQEEFSSFLECLQLTLTAYGKSCGFHKAAVANIIFSNLDVSPSCVFIAGQCFLRLAACGSPGSGGDNYAAAWLKQQQFLLNSLHAQLDALFENVKEVEDSYKRFNLEEPIANIAKISEKGFVRQKQCIAKQFQNLAVFFKIMLTGKFPARKKILPESILSLIWRGLLINCQTITKLKQSIDSSSLATVISSINLASLEILDALVISCRMNLLPFSSMICRIFSQTLKWTETECWPFGITKPQCCLRVKTYECLCNWLSVTRACSGIEKFDDDILHSVLYDIHQEPPAVALKVPGGKGKKNKANLTEEVSPLNNFILDPEMSANVCEAALKCTSILLSTSSSLLKPDHHRNLQETIVQKIIVIQQCMMPPPYSNVMCRLAIYDVLLSLCQNSHHSFPPPINFAPELFSNGIQDSSLEVSRHCLFAMRNIDKILHPVCPTLDVLVSGQNLAMINVTAHTAEEESFLLNDESARKRRMKRKREQVTSTPVSNNHSKRSFIAGNDKLTSNHCSGIGNNVSETFLDSSMIDTVAPCASQKNDDTILNGITDSDRHEIATEKKICTEGNRVEANLSESVISEGSEVLKGSAVERGEAQTQGSAEVCVNIREPVDKIHLPVSTSSDSQNKLISNNENHEVNSASADDSENEMLKSFVDEVE